MTVKFYSFSKRQNSTSQPAANSELLTLSSVELKEECNFVTPVLKLKGLTNGTTFVPGLYNYVYIPLWTRYYFITDWKFINGLWEVQLNMDVLASHKTEIGNTQAYVIRSASQYNGNLIDSFYPATSVKSISKQSVGSEIYHSSLPSGSYIIGVVNNASSGLNVGAINYYALTTAQLSSLLQYLFSNNIYNVSNVTEMGEGLYKSLFDPFQYIVSCMWFPFETSSFGNTTENIKVGYWDTGISGTRVHYIVKQMNVKSDSPISRHPLAATRGNYLNFAPYTTLTLYYPPFGEIPIDTTFNQYGSSTYLWCKLFVDSITGMADLYVTLTDGTDSDHGADPYRYMFVKTAQIGVPIQLAKIAPEGGFVNSAITSATGFVGSIIDALGANNQIFQGIIDGTKAAMAKVSTAGANGSFIEIVEPPYLVCEFCSLASENITEYGRPLCDTKYINTLSGYIKCGEANYPFTGTDIERKIINNYLASGFFYE